MKVSEIIKPKIKKFETTVIDEPSEKILEAAGMEGWHVVSVFWCSNKGPRYGMIDRALLQREKSE